MEKLKEFLTSKKAKTFYWQTANGALSLVIVYIADINWVYAPMILPILNLISKELNKKYL